MHSFNPKMSQGLRVAMMVLVVGALLGTSGCSWFKKKKPVAQPPVVEAPVANPVTPVNAQPEGPRPGDLQPFPAGTVETVYFNFDKSSIRSDQVAVVDKDLTYLKDHADNKVYVEGHCDERGTVEYNFALGHRRAASVRDYFIKHGIVADRIAVASKGKEQPADPGKNEAAFKKNRRVEFKRMF